jgi:hypothetical protein
VWWLAPLVVTALELACGGRTGLLVLGGGGDAGALDSSPPPPLHTCPYSTGSQKGAPWPMTGRCWNHSARADVAAAPSSNEAWTRSLGGAPSSAVIGADGTLYVGTGTHLFALGARGSIQWTFDAGGQVGASAAIAEDGTVYVAQQDPSRATIQLDALEPTGAVRWAIAVSNTNQPALPVIGPNGDVYLGLGAVLEAIGPGGVVAWQYQYPPNGTTDSSPVVGPDGTIYATLSGEPNLVAVDPTGKPKWQFDVKSVDARYVLGADVEGSPAVGADGTVYIASGMHDGPAASFTTVFAVDPAGHLRWKRDFGSPNGDICLASPALGPDGSVVVVNIQGTVGSVTAAGALAWTFETHDIGASSPAIDVSGNVFVGTQRALYAIRPGGALAWSLPVKAGVSGAPAIGAGGDVVVSSSDGVVHAIGP